MDRPERGGTLVRPVLDEAAEEAVLRALTGLKLGVREEFLTTAQAGQWLREHEWDEQHVLAAFAATDAHEMYVVRGDGWRLLSPDFGDGMHFVLMTQTEEPI